MLSSQIYEAIVIGVSAGGFRALSEIFRELPANLPQGVVVVQHRRADADDYLTRHLDDISRISVREATDKQVVSPGTAYLAPAGYHLLIDDDHTLSLSLDGPVNHSRPSIDVLFESAADAYGAGLVGVILTGASSDGSRGLSRIHQCGGLTIVQDPKTAESIYMPAAALKRFTPDHVLPLSAIGSFLASLETKGKRRSTRAVNMRGHRA